MKRYLCLVVVLLVAVPWLIMGAALSQGEDEDSVMGDLEGPAMLFGISPNDEGNYRVSTFLVLIWSYLCDLSYRDIEEIGPIVGAPLDEYGGCNLDQILLTLHSRIRELERGPSQSTSVQYGDSLSSRVATLEDNVRILFSNQQIGVSQRPDESYNRVEILRNDMYYQIQRLENQIQDLRWEISRLRGY